MAIMGDYFLAKFFLRSHRLQSRAIRHSSTSRIRGGKLTLDPGPCRVAMASVVRLFDQQQ